jgi:transposase
MAISSDARDRLALRFGVLLPHLNERQRRLLLAAEARLLGHGGVRAVAQVAGVSESTVRKGVFELEEGQDLFPDGRARREGGGRKSAEELDAGLVRALLALVEPEERGDPEPPLRWTTKSLRRLAGELTRQEHPVSAPTAGGCCGRPASACRRMPSRWRVPGTRTGMPSSAISTSRSRTTRPAGSR